MYFTVCATALSTAMYLIYVNAAPEGPRGGSWQGLLFGVAGSALMIVAGLLAGRKKVPRLRIGSARFWLKAHIWLGLLSVPLIAFHAGFRWGGVLEQLLLIVFGLVVLSGLAGVAFQQYLPRHIKETSSREAIFEQIPHVCMVLRGTADDRVVARCGTLFPPVDDEFDPPADGSNIDVSQRALEFELLRSFYVEIVRPFLNYPSTTQSPMGNASRAEALFAQIRAATPSAGHTILTQLASICDERRELAKQARLHHWLHWWLFVHVPLSMSLLVLGVAHALMSVYY